MNFNWLRKLNPLRTRYYVIEKEVTDYNRPLPDYEYGTKIVYNVAYRSIDNFFDLCHLSNFDTLDEAKEFIQRKVNKTGGEKIVYKY